MNLVCGFSSTDFSLCGFDLGLVLAGKPNKPKEKAHRLSLCHLKTASIILRELLLMVGFTAASRKLDRFSMRSMPVRLGPSLFARKQRRRIGQSLGQDQALQSCQPMMIVTCPVVGLAAVRCGLQFIGQRGRPLFPSEMSLFGKPHCHRKRLGLPGFGKYRAAFVARQ